MGEWARTAARQQQYVDCRRLCRAGRRHRAADAHHLQAGGPNRIAAYHTGIPRPAKRSAVRRHDQPRFVHTATRPVALTKLRHTSGGFGAVCRPQAALRRTDQSVHHGHGVIMIHDQARQRLPRPHRAIADPRHQQGSRTIQQADTPQPHVAPHHQEQQVNAHHVHRIGTEPDRRKRQGGQPLQKGQKSLQTPPQRSRNETAETGNKEKAQRQRQNDVGERHHHKIGQQADQRNGLEVVGHQRCRAQLGHQRHTEQTMQRTQPTETAPSRRKWHAAGKHDNRKDGEEGKLETYVKQIPR